MRWILSTSGTSAQLNSREGVLHLTSHTGDVDTGYEICSPLAIGMEETVS
jgi:hypothetical protein